MARPAKATVAQLARLEEIARARLAIPTDKDLEKELGLPKKCIQRWLTKIRGKLQRFVL